MDGDVKTHQLDERLVLAKPKKVGQVVRVIFGRINGRELALSVQVAVDATSNVGKLGDPVLNSHHEIRIGG